MMDDSKHIIIQAKNARIIAILAEKFDGSLAKAMDVFYHSATAQMIQDGVADLRPLERKCSILPADIRKQPGMTDRREAFWSSLV